MHKQAAYLGKTVNFPSEHGVTAGSKPKGGPSKYRGVSWSKSKGKWISQINIDGKPTYLGAYETEEEVSQVKSVTWSIRSLTHSLTHSVDGSAFLGRNRKRRIIATLASPPL